MSSTPMSAKSMSQPSLVRGQSVEINARAIAEATKDNVIMIENFKHQDDWVSNSERRRCHICTKNFGAFRRKHHCRVCGEIVCTSCTLKKQVMLPMVGQTEAKVCVTCVLAYCKPAGFDGSQNGSMLSPASFSIPSSVSSRDGRGARSDFSRNNTHLHSPDVMSSGDAESYFSDDFDYPLDFDWEHPWPKPPIVPDEAQRLDALRSFDILDTPQEDVFDIICDLVSKSLNCPIAAVSFIDHDRQWFKASVGLIQEEIPRNVSFCAHVLYTKESIIVPDTALDKRFEKNPLVTGRAGIRFYAASPIVSPSTGLVLGTVFVFDNHPKMRDQVDLATLEKLAGVAMKNLEDRRATVTSSVYDQRQSGTTDRSSAMTSVSQDFQVQSPNPQSVATPSPLPPAVNSTTATFASPATVSAPSPAAVAPPAAPVVAAQTPPPASSPAQPSVTTATNAVPPPTTTNAVVPTAPPTVAAVPNVESMLLDLLDKTTTTQQQIALQQSNMHATIAGHSSQIDKLAEAVARMERKLGGGEPKKEGTE